MGFHVSLLCRAGTEARTCCKLQSTKFYSNKQTRSPQKPKQKQTHKQTNKNQQTQNISENQRCLHTNFLTLSIAFYIFMSNFLHKHGQIKEKGQSHLERIPSIIRKARISRGLDNEKKTFFLTDPSPWTELRGGNESLVPIPQEYALFKLGFRRCAQNPCWNKYLLLHEGIRSSGHGLSTRGCWYL